MPTPLVVTAEGLNLRDVPSLQGKIIDVLGRGTVVEWLDSSGDDYWRKIKSSGSVGWASHKYLRPEITGAPPSELPWFEIAYGEIGVKEVIPNGTRKLL